MFYIGSMKDSKTIIDLVRSVVVLIKRFVVLAFQFHKILIMTQLAMGLTNFFMVAIKKIMKEHSFTSQAIRTMHKD